MFQLIFCLLIAHPSFAARSSPTLDEEREELEVLQGKFTEFQNSLAKADAEFSRLRAIVGQREFRSPRTDSITTLVRTTTQQWKAIERRYDRDKEQGLDLSRFGHSRFVELSADFLRYLGMRKHGRFGTGVPMPLLLAQWRGLSEGRKLESPPSRARRTGELNDIRLNEEDSLLIMTVRGGLIRGRFAGMVDDEILLREALPGPFTREQRTNGHYRQLPLDNVARIEIVRKPPGLSLSESPAAVITMEGDYALYQAVPGTIYRIDYKPDDVEMVEMIKDGRASEVRRRPRVVKLNASPGDRPSFTHVYFDDCGSLLERAR